MGLLLAALLVAVIMLVVVVSRHNNDNGQSNVADKRGTDPLSVQWIHFVASYMSVAKTKAEKRLIQTMLQDLLRQGYVLPADVYVDGQRAASMLPAPAVAAGQVTPAEVPAKQSASPLIQLDNVSILLYLGAFLFVASVGLFVAFGGFSGITRTIAVAVVALVLYACGVWLYSRQAKLAQAGLAFAGIGLATAPFVGVAAYSFVLHQSSGALVWLCTSFACVALYAHALLVLRRPLLNYLLIFTFLSLVESGVSVVHAPIYYFGWGLSDLGILLAFISRYKGLGQPLQEASNASARFFIPLAVITSLVLIGSQGAGQLGVSLLLACTYYALQLLYGVSAERPLNAIASQVALLAAAGALTYGWYQEYWVAAIAVLFVCAAQGLAILVMDKKAELAVNFASILLAANVATVWLAFEKPALVAGGVALLCANALIVWYRQARADAYCVAALAWMTLPFIIGQLYLDPRLTMPWQATVSLVQLFVQFLIMQNVFNRQSQGWRQAAKAVYAVSILSVLVVTFLATPQVVFIIPLAIAATLVYMRERTPDPEWVMLAGAVTVLPILKLASQSNWFAASTSVALLVNLALTLRYREALTHWMWAAALFLLPPALGAGLLGNWTPSEFGWAYVVALAVFIFSRAVARGLIPVLRQDIETGSQAYVAGYILAGFMALVMTLSGANSQLHASLVLAIIGSAVWLLGTKVERQPLLLAGVPLVAQALLLSATRAAVHDVRFDYYLAASIGISLAGYLASLIVQPQKPGLAAIRQASLVAGLIVPFSVAFVGETHLLMPVGALVFAAMLLHYVYKLGQQYREWVGALGLLGVWWLMWPFGVRNAQAYTHVLAALFAGYAVWRYARHEQAAYDKYLIAMLATATVPLALQALIGTAGDVYGWWLLLEELFFMLLGMVLRKHFIIWWGLLVTLGAVLYQLRNLGWAALTLLALFLIGLAVYLLQKQEKKQ